jgi:hypothetical protein
LYFSLGSYESYIREMSDINITNNIITINGADYLGLWGNDAFGAIGFAFRERFGNQSLTNLIACNNTINTDQYWTNTWYRNMTSDHIELFNVMNINSSSCSPYISLTLSNVSFGTTSQGSTNYLQNVQEVDTNLLDTKVEMSNTDFSDGAGHSFLAGNLTYGFSFVPVTDPALITNPNTITMYRNATYQNDYYNYTLSIPVDAYPATYISTLTLSYSANSAPSGIEIYTR